MSDHEKISTQSPRAQNRIKGNHGIYESNDPTETLRKVSAKGKNREGGLSRPCK